MTLKNDTIYIVKIGLKLYKNAQVLEVGDTVSPDDVEVIKAGLNKFSQESHRFVLIDFKNCRVRKDAAERMLDLQTAGYSMGLMVIIVSKTSIGHAPTLDEGIAFAKSQKKMDQERRKILMYWIPQLKKRLAVAQSARQEIEKKGINIEDLRMEKRKAFYVVSSMIKQIESILALKRETKDNPLVLKMHSEMRKIIEAEFKGAYGGSIG